MGRKRLITDSYPVVKNREGPAGHKEALASELGEEPPPPSEEEVALELLRQFDLAWQYGPCTGITRLQRWHRAEQLGLEPPPEVRQVLKAHPEDPRFQCRSGQPLVPLSPLRDCPDHPALDSPASHGKLWNIPEIQWLLISSPP
ncbi:DNA polymerase delta subunit 4-like isoform X1 [Dipodomys merriami]|uniref:DNA polymerase delta subunit 4-like isoform X1 n=1 Tax=Dipodomys merriami TaxID=94247 RepID=UPI0038502780